MTDQPASPLKGVPYRRFLTPANIEALKRHLEGAESGEITAFVVCSVGPRWTTKRTASGGMTRAERLNLLGQLQLIIEELTRDELAED
jgi:hypothetical protein